MTSHTSSTPDQSPLVALVHKQLAALEALASDGYAEAAALRTDIAALAGQLGDAVVRLARLEGTLQSHAQLLAAIRAGLMQLPDATSAVAPAPAVAAPVSAAAFIPAPPVPAAATAPRPTVAERAAAPVPPTAAPVPDAAPASVTPEQRPSTLASPQPSLAPAPPATVTSAPLSSTEAASTGPQVQRGSRVRVVFDDDTTETYTIVRQEETNRQRNQIGENSPLGAALLGATVGELRSFRVRPAGPEQMVEVLAIEG